MNQEHYEIVTKALSYIVQNRKEQPSIAEMAKVVNLSEVHFSKIFTEWAGITPKKFLQSITLSALKKKITESANILELTYSEGLSAPSRVYDLFVNIEAVTPHEYKTSGQGIEIEFGYSDCPFGMCFLAQTSRGICALEFFQTKEEKKIITENFFDKWKNASIQENQDVIAKAIYEIFYERKKQKSALLFGTPFQIKVWQALINIPFATVSSYSQIAKIIGAPSSSRAVASAIAKNNIGYLIPCHRVIQNMGSHGGYRWSSDRKLAILGWEHTRKALQPLQFRKAKHSDFSYFQKLCEESQISSTDFLQEEFLVAEQEEELVGFIRECIFGDIHEIASLYILPKWRNNGYGKQLVKEIIKKSSAEVLFCDCYKDSYANRGLETLYKCLGFHQMKNPPKAVIAKLQKAFSKIQGYEVEESELFETFAFFYYDRVCLYGI